MDDESLKMFFEWTCQYNSNPVFAHRCDMYVEVAKEHREKQTNLINNNGTKRELIRNAFESYTDKFCIVMQEYMSRENTGMVKKAMMHVFDSERGLEWFSQKPTKGLLFNITYYCRLIYYLHIREFFSGAVCCGRKMTINSISHILAGHESCEKDAVCNNEKAVISDEFFCFSSIETFMKKNTNDKEFEDFCLSLNLKDFQ